MSQIVAGVYEIIEEIGSGGGGTVYSGQHLRLNKRIVLKADNRTLEAKPDVLRREVDALKNLNHTYIPQVYDFIQENDVVYTVMDFIEGESLDKALERGERFRQPWVILWACQLLEALCYLHSRPPYGILHGDIKPANIMLTPQGDIRLIDFNIALALGETGAVRVGYSQGYASPEHYGLDYSGISVTRGVKTETRRDPAETVVPSEGRSSGTRDGHGVLLDARSDIYCLGATLYHLLTGRRPNQDAKEVEPVSAEDGVSPTIAAIIQKAMEPDPGMRFQSAAEMLWEFEHLRENDPRTRRHKRRVRITAAALTSLFLMGGLCSFAGLRQMQQTEAAARLEAEAAEADERAAKEAEQQAKQALAAVGDGENALRDGDIPMAVSKSLEALSLESPYAASAQRVLTDALGVYDLSDGFKSYLMLDLPGEPLKVELSSEGTRVAALVRGKVLAFDTETGQLLADLPADPSALSDVAFAGENVLLYAGVGALRAYNLAENREVWSGGAATAISISADGSTVAALYKDETAVTLYDAATGSVIQTVALEAPTQQIAANDVFADPENDLFCLNSDGTLMAVSTAGGGVRIHDLQNSDNDLIILDESAYTHLEGGFFGQYLAFAANSNDESIFAIIDVPGTLQTCGAISAMPFHVQTDKSGIYLSSKNLLVKVEPENGEQEELAFTGADITGFRKNGAYVIAATADDAFSFFGAQATLLSRHEEEGRGDFVRLAGSYAVAGNLDAPSLRILKLENHPEARTFSYDPAYAHDETRISADGQTVILFRYNRFRLYAKNGKILSDVEIPDADQVYDQQFRREDGGSFLDVIYNSGLVRRYSAADGSLVSETAGEKPDGFLEEFLTDHWRIVSELHSAPEVYDRESGELVRKLDVDGYLTYATQTGEYVITEYVSAQGTRYGLLLNGDCEPLAKLPCLCDVLEDGTLIFDDTLGSLRESRVYSLQELIALAQSYAEPAG